MFRERLGISIYPEKAELEKIKEYIELSSEKGFGLVFINLIDVFESNDDEKINLYKNIINICKQNNMKVTVDVNESTLKSKLVNIDFKNPDLSYFNKLGVDVIRLDSQFDGLFEATLTYNKYNIKIELNPSVMSKSIENILSYKANTQNLQVLHNFYPQNLTGLSYSEYKKVNLRMRQNGLKIGSFVTIVDHDSVGPWNISQNLPTLEIHRNMPIGLQLNHLLSTNESDYFYISTQFATANELDELINNFIYKRIIKVDFLKEITNTEKEIINYENHLVRGDLNDYFFRSTETRKIFSNKKIEPRIYKSSTVPKGAIVIPNDKYKKYKGELQIVVKDFDNDGMRNVVGHISEKFLFILDEIKSWEHFKII